MDNQQKGKIPSEDPPESSEMMQTDDNSCEEKFVWPWVGIVANIPTELDKNGRRVGKSGSTLRDDLILKGYNPTRVTPIWSYKGHSGFALVEFTKDFEGFENALKFGRSYESDRHGKKDWEKAFHLRDDKLYGWVAREDDYNRSGPVGKEVRRKRDLKSVSQLQEEDQRKMKALVENLSQSIEMKKTCKEELEKQTDENARVLETCVAHNIELNNIYKAKVEEINRNQHEFYEHIMREHEESMMELERKKKELDERARNIEQRAIRNEAEIAKSRLEREMNQKAMWVQNEANVEAMKLAEKHQKERQKLHEKLKAMEAKLSETQELELEIEKLKGEANVMKHMAGNDAVLIEKIAKTQIDLEARETALHEKMMTLSLKERATNDEYQEARKELIQFWNGNENLMKGEKIRMKRMGELNPEPFLPAVKRAHKGSNAKAESRAIELCSLWEEHVGDVQWTPFKVDVSDGYGFEKRVVDENDAKLMNLKREYGEEVYDEVVRAKLEREEYNASGSYVVQELWNYEEKRKATMEEATDVMMKVVRKIKLRSDIALKKNKRTRR